jgi:hypothetical protein
MRFIPSFPVVKYPLSPGSRLMIPPPFFSCCLLSFASAAVHSSPISKNKSVPSILFSNPFKLDVFLYEKIFLRKEYFPVFDIQRF